MAQQRDDYTNGTRYPASSGARPGKLETKLEGLQTPRGWGLFLIRSMVDEMHVTSDEVHHTVGLVMHLEGGEDAG